MKLTKRAAGALSISSGDTVLSGRGLKMKAEGLSFSACEGLCKTGRLPAVAWKQEARSFGGGEQSRKAAVVFLSADMAERIESLVHGPSGRQ